MALPILLLTSEFPPFPGGIACYAHELARAADRLGFHVEVLAPRYDSGAAESPSGEPWVIHSYPRRKYRFWHTITDLFKVRRLLRQRHWHLVHAIDPYWALCLGFLRRFMSFRYLATLHGSDVFDLIGARKALLLTGGRPFALADRVVVNSHFTKGLLYQHHTLPRSLDTRVTHLGVSAEWFTPMDQAVAEKLRQRLALREQERVILTVARLERRKGHLQVLAALDILWEKGVRNFCYIVAGKPDDEPYVAELRAQAATRPYRVELTGALTAGEIKALYGLATVFCMPGKSVPGKVEGFGLAYLEAAAQGLPTVACQLYAMPEVIKQGETGLLVPEGDDRALAEALEFLLGDESEARRFSLAARDWARSFTWERCARLTYEDFPGAPEKMNTVREPLAGAFP